MVGPGSSEKHERESQQKSDQTTKTNASSALSDLKRRILRKTGPWYRKYVVQAILRRQSVAPTQDGRHIELNGSTDVTLIDERTGLPYIDNSIRSSRYTIWNFLPCQLWFQFSKIANLFFLIIGVLQLVPGLSTTGSFTTILPLLFFLGFTILREGYDDICRYQLDKIDNKKLARVWSESKATRSSILPATLLDTCKEYWQLFKGDSEGKRIFQLGKRISTINSVVASSIDFSDDIPESGPGAASWVTVAWKDLKVGDVIELRRNDSIPADIVLLFADGRDGVAYIETMALDGETNLKSRRPPNLLSCETLADISQCRAQFSVEDPNPNLYEFFGKVSVNGKISPLTPENIVYRGSTLRNTNRAFGMITNTGEECKLRMNASRNPRSKAPAIQSVTNRVVMVLVAFVILLATGCTAGYEIWSKIFERKAWYLQGAHLGAGEIFVAFAIAFNNFIPLSLYVSLELVKFAQFLLLHDVEMYDEASNTPMVSNTQNIYENLGQVGYIFSDKTGTLTENVMRFQQVSVAGMALHHNKTSTDEKKKSLDISSPPSPVQPGTPRIVEHPVSDIRPSVDGYPFPNLQSSLSVPALGRSISQDKFSGQQSIKDFLQNLWTNPNAEVANKVRLFLLSLALCHTCFPEVREGGKIGYQAASPDELALVEAAAELGYVISDRTARSITLSVITSDSGTSSKEVYEVLDVVEFSSKRKRMSIVVKFPDGRICLFCKGADSAIQPRLSLSSSALQKASGVKLRREQRKSFEVEEAIARMSHDEQSRKSFQRSSINLARASMELGRRVSNQNQRVSSFDGHSRFDDGGASSPRMSTQLRRKFLELPNSGPGTPQFKPDARSLDDETIFERCHEHIDEFATDGLRTLMFAYRFIPADEYSSWSKLYNNATTSLVNRQEMIESAAELIEKDFKLAGATGIEDKLQNGVPETIEKLQKANIKIWMLTGDKRETAINIAHSARICKTYSHIVILDHKKGPLIDQIEATLLETTEGRTAHSVVVIDGQTLMEVEHSTPLADAFYNLLLRVDSVICCRASPSQKASIVKNIRHKVPSSITLAIGDGGNDIAMIQEAHVGIGISGREGLQAARVADYSIAQFRFLQRLLLVHGHWNYVRISRYVLYTFWKEMFFYCIQVLYQRWNGYTGTSLYESWSLTFWNVLFTSLAVMIPGIFEQDLSAETLLAFPELYDYGQQCKGLNLRKCAMWMVLAAIESVMVYFMVYYLYGTVASTKDNGIFALGDLAFSVCVVFINLKLLILDYRYKTWIPLTSFVITIAGWWVWNLLLSGIYSNTQNTYAVSHGFIEHFGTDPFWWLTLVVVSGVLVAFELTVNTLKIVYREYMAPPISDE
ncbi:putative phospholipid-transporting ATPase DNF3 [Lachnellula suecica]|uniref:Phospholipid-transporting ATPase n=1 Tax=Lachnellula suecica TaxID=602035 RepID=A0A8T9C8C0_9HELO|nr:putative phospholipid-transporting ATPase DNF3 [Lachnellula suecica]